VTIDTPTGDGHVSIERCADVSREIGTHLDATDAIPVRYRLEVSSPGLDRRLAREKDFVAAQGAEVRIETRRPLDGRRNYRGRLVGYEGGTAHVVVDGQPVAIPFAEIGKAQIVYEFTRADFAKR
jgi:ribosome maturation factor RimP